MAKDYCSPNYPVAQPGKPAFQCMLEAEERCDARKEWYEEHPGEMPPADFYKNSSKDYEDIERGQSLMGAMTFEPGDAFCMKGKKE